MSKKLTLYGAEFSLYSGKARSYLRKKGIDFDEITSTLKVYKDFIVPRTGVRYIPVVQTADDVVIQDTTEIIDHLEAEYPKGSVYPDTPKQKLASLLIETYADEWLVIPAMHYRWNYPAINERFIYGEFGSMVFPNALGFIQRFVGKKVGDKFRGFVPRLGIREQNIPAIESSYVQLLSDLNTHFEKYDFLLGDKPSIGDFGLIGPFYAHLYRDPAPGKLMRKKAPAVCQWVRRMNDQQPYLLERSWLPNDEVPETLFPVLKRMAQEQLPVIQETDRLLGEWRENNPEAQEVARIIGEHTFSIDGVEAQRVALPYCLWMFQRPVDFFKSLDQSEDVLTFLKTIGFGQALKAGVRNRVMRVDNKLCLESQE